MTQAAEQAQPITLAEYFELEEQSEHCNEYYKGCVFIKPCNSFNHALIATNVGGCLRNLLKASGYKVFSGNLKLYIESEDIVTYPDGMIVCGSPKMAKGRNDTIVNPTLIVEVLSKSTENYDLGGKFDIYRELESFQEYLVVDQYRAFVRHYQKIGQDEWKLYIYHKIEDIVELPSLNVKLPLAEIYEKVEFVPRPKRRIPGVHRLKKKK